MTLKLFAIPYDDDKRMTYAKEYLENSGYIYINDVNDADFCVLPVQTKTNMIKGMEKKILFTGGEYENTINYLNDDVFVRENAILTAEGAINLAINNSEISLYNSNVLICGYGRIAKKIHKILNALSANITVCSRSDLSKFEAKSNYANIISFSDLANKNDYDFIFNTVPHIIFTNKELHALKKDAILIDLASFPGGVDTLVANSLNINYIDGKGLPKKVSPKTAGILVGKTIKKIIERGI